MNAADFVLWVLYAAVFAGLLALIALVALTVLYRVGLRRLDRIDAEIRMDRDERESTNNVRTLQRWELARRMERKSR